LDDQMGVSRLGLADVPHGPRGDAEREVGDHPSVTRNLEREEVADHDLDAATEARAGRLGEVGVDLDGGDASAGIQERCGEHAAARPHLYDVVEVAD